MFNTNDMQNENEKDLNNIIENLKSNNLKLEKKLDRTLKRYEKSKLLIEKLEKSNLEYLDEIQTLKSVISVYDKRILKGPQEACQSDSEDQYSDEIDSFDKASTKDDNHLINLKTAKKKNHSKNATEIPNQLYESESSVKNQMIKPKNQTSNQPKFKSMREKIDLNIQLSEQDKQELLGRNSLKKIVSQDLNQKKENENNLANELLKSLDLKNLSKEEEINYIESYDQPKIFDENTVLDILCGLGITCSRHFDDALLVPADYSYSYQFKVNRIPQRLLKFKDFAPKVFNQIRQHWGITNSDFMLSFDFEKLEAIRGTGKSGAFFIYTDDKRFVLKTTTGAERDFLWQMLPYYFLYIRKNPNTLLPRFYGVYSMKHEGIGGMVRFVIMNNCFNTIQPISEVYDLKGSTLGRSSGESAKPGSILKDLDIKRKFYFDHDIANLFLDQLKYDSEFLAEHNVMDYSLLVGIVNEDSLKGTKKLEKENYPPDNSKKTIFQADEFGLLTWNPELKRKEIYYFGIIDILQIYSSKKKLEHLFKSVAFKTETISIVEPSFYAKRFCTFLSKIVDETPKSISKASKLIEKQDESKLSEKNETSSSSDNETIKKSKKTTKKPSKTHHRSSSTDRDSQSISRKVKSKNNLS